MTQNSQENQDVTQEPANENAPRKGLPPLALRALHSTWLHVESGDPISFVDDGHSWAWGTPGMAEIFRIPVADEPTLGGPWAAMSFLPIGTTWAKAEALAAQSAAPVSQAVQ